MDEGPVGPDAIGAHFEIARIGANIAVDCAMALAEQGLLTDERSLGLEQLVRQLARACRRGNGQIAETQFERMAEVLRLRRERSGKTS